MTRKDFILIAEAIAAARDKVSIGDDVEGFAVNAVAHELADALSEGNARFDVDRFMKAAGYRT